MKKNNKGYMLAETLIVTAFVAGVMIYLCVQLTNLSNSYEKNHSYNTVSNLYALSDIIYFINNNSSITNYVSEIDEIGEICSYNNTTTNCLSFRNLLALENVNTLLIAKNNNSIDFSAYSESLKDYVNTINFNGSEAYILIATFNDNTYASLKFDISVGGNS